ncbi:MAG TPA: sarcosine oxidase subunit gamma family protein [Steroidobacteraceae bacterium]|jgi:sarcosine oxidase subunit gamma|nr:sarcosine oxidase subunit gamma family protein [Steroidobacteraceae bacterium]
MHADPTIIEASAFAGLPAAVGSGGGVIATERHGLGVARLAARRGQSARLTELFRASLGAELPSGPRRTSLGDVGVAGVGPETWLATRDGAGNAFAESLRRLLGDCAAVSDQSDAYVILRLTGPKVRDMLAKLVPIDVHPRGFQVNDVAQTVCGYVNVTLWRLEDSAQSDPAFEIWAGRSLAVSLHQAICHGAAEFGFVRETT